MQCCRGSCRCDRVVCFPAGRLVRTGQSTIVRCLELLTVLSRYSYLRGSAGILRVWLSVAKSCFAPKDFGCGSVAVSCGRKWPRRPRARCPPRWSRCGGGTPHQLTLHPVTQLPLSPGSSANNNKTYQYAAFNSNCKAVICESRRPSWSLMVDSINSCLRRETTESPNNPATSWSSASMMTWQPSMATARLSRISSPLGLVVALNSAQSLT